jgi:hypothetical protein
VNLSFLHWPNLTRPTPSAVWQPLFTVLRAMAPWRMGASRVGCAGVC